MHVGTVLCGLATAGLEVTGAGDLALSNKPTSRRLFGYLGSENFLDTEHMLKIGG